MERSESLADQFEAQRPRLRAVAMRLLGSTADAEDALQEAWIRVDRGTPDEVENLAGWFTTIVSRVSLDMLRSRRRRPEIDVDSTDVPSREDPEQEVLLADSVGLAMLVVLESLTPAERLAFVLHDMFAMSFEEIAPIVERTPVAARQLASRARRKVQGGTPAYEEDFERKRAVVDAFLQASRAGDFQALLALLDPDVVLRADRVAAEMGADELTRGAQLVAQFFPGRAKAARMAVVNGAPGLIWTRGQTPIVVFDFEIENDRILAIDLVADPETHAELDLEFHRNR